MFSDALYPSLASGRWWLCFLDFSGSFSIALFPVLQLKGATRWNVFSSTPTVQTHIHSIWSLSPPRCFLFIPALWQRIAMMGVKVLRHTAIPRCALSRVYGTLHIAEHRPRCLCLISIPSHYSARVERTQMLSLFLHPVVRPQGHHTHVNLGLWCGVSSFHATHHFSYPWLEWNDLNILQQCMARFDGTVYHMIICDSHNCTWYNA